MAASTPFFSSILNVPSSKISNSDVGSNKIPFSVQKNRSSTHSRPRNPISISESCPSSSGSCNSAAVHNSLTLDHGSINDEEVQSRIGSKVRVKVPLKVYHVPKVPEIDLTGRVGLLKQYVGFHKGKRISANLPYKVELVAEEISGRDGKPVKFLAHLREDEFEFLDYDMNMMV